MKRALLSLALLCAGCSTVPQASFMDRVFKVKNACSTPVPGVGGTVVGGQAMPIATAPAVAGTGFEEQGYLMTPPYPAATAPMGVSAPVTMVPATPVPAQPQGHPWFRWMRRNRTP
jgi:hypothetical protein